MDNHNNQVADNVRENIGAVQSLPAFLNTAGQLTKDECVEIVDQALIMIENIFVHLPLKRAMYGINPVQRLKLLKQHIKNISERAFHDELISIYTQLRDLHTNYILPEPYRSKTAFVPFRIEEYFENNIRHYVVTQISPIVNSSNFKPGVIVTHWNNIPIDRAVEINAEREAGSNLAARHARGLASMTSRWMGMSLPPDEEEVTIRYLSNGIAQEIRFPWQIFVPDAPNGSVDLLSPKGETAHLMGIDAKTEIQRWVLKLLFSPAAVQLHREMTSKETNALLGGAAVTDDADKALATTSSMPDVFSDFREIATADGPFAYLRIRTFNVANVDAFIQEFIRLIGLLPQNGLILDVRGNGGGIITAGELLLQLLTPQKIEPTRLHFINSPLTLKLCQQNDAFTQWQESIEQSLEIGTTLSQGFPLLPVETYNSIGQKYQGPVVLIIDALCYSTTDIFIAGFRDHKIGKILGTSKNTGAGGANVWPHDLLQQFFSGPDSPFKPIPRGASFRVAVRQTTRVGEHLGLPIEDLGVTPDETHDMTKNDVLNGNVDLINKAVEILKGMKGYSLKADLKGADITITGKNLDRVDIYLNNRPRGSVDIVDKKATFKIQPPASGTLSLRGFDKNQLVISAQKQL